MNIQNTDNDLPHNIVASAFCDLKTVKSAMMFADDIFEETKWRSANIEIVIIINCN